MPGTVRQVQMPQAAQTLSTLTRVDYTDAFEVDTDSSQDRTAEQWARAIIEGAPLPVRKALRSGWRTLGLQLGSTESEQHVLGWPVRRSTPEFALLGTHSYLGFDAELLFKREEHMLLCGTLVMKENALARALWAGLAPFHVRVVRSVLDRTATRASRA